jgi:UDP-N-acetylmuramate dehydrogenase
MMIKKKSQMNITAIRELFDAGLFRGQVMYDEPMSAHTSLKIGGPVDIMAIPEDPLSLKNLLITANSADTPVIVIGSGTNLLVSDSGIRGVAISLASFDRIELTRGSDEDHVQLFVNAGVPLSRVINFAKDNGYSGLEALVGIPGSFGGAVCMNAGSFGAEVKDVIHSIAVMNSKGDINILEKDEIEFSYRSSNLPEDSIILSANVLLKKDNTDDISERIRDFLKRKKGTQPLGERSAGCVFKNPEGDAAGRLIDAARCKGMRMGDVEVSTVHANYFINRGRATCREFIELMENVITRVKEQSGIILDAEIKIVGENIKTRKINQKSNKGINSGL